MTPNTRTAALIAASFVLAACGAGSSDSGSTLETESGSSRALLAAPVQLEDAQRLSSGTNFVTALHADGTVYAWGSNDAGQLGIKASAGSLVPVMVTGLSAVQALQSGANHSAVLRTDGTVWTWGLNTSGQLGNGRADAGSFMPAKVAGLSPVTAITAGERHTYTLTQAGEVWGWGRMPDRNSTEPRRVNQLQNVRRIAAGKDFTLAIKSDGSVWGWGGNGYGQLGNGGRVTPVPAPTRVLGVDRVVRVAGGLMHAMALRDDGSVWTWGGNTYNQLGYSAASSYTAQKVSGLPTPINGASGVKAIAAGSYNSAVLYTDGSAWIWGDNSAGQFGNGTLTGSAVPVKVNSVTDIVALTVSDGFVALLDRNGALYSTGFNGRGQLGNNTLSDSSVPVKVVGLSGVAYLKLGKSSGK